MRHLVSVIAAIAMMLAVRSLGFSESASGVDPRTLAAIGFVIIASFSIGGIVAEFSLPKIIGYIVTGIVLGPAISDMLSVRVVREMQVFNTLALGLIALGAGLELDLRAIARVWKTLFSTVLFKVPLLLVLMGGTFLAIHFFHPLLEISNQQAFALALILSVLGIGTSPAIALAVVRETKAKGRLTDILLAIVVVKDLVVVVMLAIAIGIAGVLLEPGATLSTSVLVNVGKEIGGSIVLGIVLAGLLIAYVRWVHREMLLAITALVLLAAELCEHFHLELLLVFIAVGFIVRNFSKFEHQVLEPVERVALPVFVVFFTTAGAALDVTNVLRLLPIGIALVVTRVIANIIAAHLGGIVGGEQPAVKNNAWLAYVPQAGVTLGLVLLASRALPALSSEIASTGMAMVGLNLLIGPILLGVGLKRAGEVPRKEAADAPVREIEPTAEEIALPTPLPPPPSRAPLPRHVPLRTDVEKLTDSLRTQAMAFVDETLISHLRTVGAAAVEHIAVSVAPIDSRGHAIALARRILDKGEPSTHDTATAARTLIVDVARTIESLDEVRNVILTEEDFENTKGAPLSIRVIRRVARVIGRRRKSLRMRVLARTALEIPLADAVSEVLRTATFIEVSIHREIKDVLEGTRSATDAEERIEAVVEAGAIELHAVFERAFYTGVTNLTRYIDGATIAGVGVRPPRLSTVHARAETRMLALPGLAARLRAYAGAAFDTVRAEAALFVLTERLAVVRRTQLAAPLANLIDEIVPELEIADAQLGELQAAVEKSALTPEEIAELAQRAAGILSVRSRSRIRRATARHRRETQANVLFAELIGALPGLPEKVALLPTLERKGEAIAQPVQVHLVERVRERLESTLQRIQGLNAPVLELALPFASQLEEAVHVAAFSFDVAGRTKADSDGTRALVVAAIGRAKTQVDALEKTLIEHVETASKTLELVIDETTRDLEELARVRESTGELMRTSVRATRRLVFSRVDDIDRAFRRQLARLSGVVADMQSRSDVQEYLLRTGRERLDAAEMRAFVERESATKRDAPLPAIYEKLFELAPLDDVRLFVSHKEHFDELISRTSRGRGLGIARVLIVGDPGAGRSTMTQTLLRRLSGVRVVVVDPAYHPRTLGVVGAIAEELACPNDIETVAARLADEPTLVLVDDLERHLPTGARLKGELNHMRLLLRETASTTHFVVTTETVPLRFFDEISALSSAFERVLRLRALDAAQLRELIERRRRLTGFKLVFEQGLRLMARRSDGMSRAERRYFDGLARSSRGNLRDALLLHRKSVRRIEGDTLFLAPTRPLRVPFLRQLSPSMLATLGVLCRHGPIDVEGVANALLIAKREAGNILAALSLAGLVVEQAAFDNVEFEIPPGIAPTLTDELATLGVIPGATR
jgi:Kef-type K+ transport system membrane component KefB